MADKFRRELDVICDVGGVKCDCCNPYKGKERKKLRKLARTHLKQDLQNKLRNIIND